MHCTNTSSACRNYSIPPKAVDSRTKQELLVEQGIPLRRWRCWDELGNLETGGNEDKQSATRNVILPFLSSVRGLPGPKGG